MGRRARRRTATSEAPPEPVKRAQAARVRVDEEVWTDFRRAIGDMAVAEVLADYVRLEVAEWLRRRSVERVVDDHELVQALTTARALSESLERTVARLERRLDDQGGQADR